MRRGAGHRSCRGLLWAVWLGCAWNGLVAPAAAQVFEVQAGASSLYDAAGGGLKVYTPNYEGRFGLGNAQGWKAGGSLKTQRFGHVVLLGDDVIRTDLPTDVFGGSRYAFTRGLSVARKGKRGGLLGFAGVSSDIFSTPFFQAGEADHVLGLFNGDYNLQPRLRAFTRNSISRDIHSLHGMEWQASDEAVTAVTGGIMTNRPYLATSLSAEKPWVSLKASYVLAARPRARRIIARTATTAASSSGSQDASIANSNVSEANKENVLVSFHVRPYLTLTGGRQNFLQASAGEAAPLAAAVNQFGVSVHLSRFQIGGNVYDSRTDDYRNFGAALSLAFPLTDRVRLISNYFHSAPSEWEAFNTFSLTLQETVSPRLGLSQLVTRTDGRTTLSFGGSLVTNLLKFSAEWQTFFVPFLRGNQFKQALVARFDVRLPGDIQFQGGTDIAPDGSVHFTTYGSSFLYHQGMPQVQGPSFSFPKYLVQGKVADEQGNPIAGAALRISGEVVFTDSRGRFFLRVRKAGPHPLTVSLENFLAPGSYEVVSAPGEVTAVREGEGAAEVSIALRRLANNPSDAQGQNTLPAGTLTGIVKLRTLAGSTGAADVWVVTDSGESARTDANGYFEILKSPAGRRQVSLDADRLPAGFHSGETNAVSTLIGAGQASRVELEVVPLQSLEGMVVDAEGNPARKGIVLCLLPNGNYTTTEQSGRFAFYDLPEGDYVIQLVENSLLEGARMVTSAKLPAAVRYGTDPAPLQFRYETGRYEIGATDSSSRKEVLPRRERAVLFSTGSRKEQPRGKRRIITSTSEQHK